MGSDRTAGKPHPVRNLRVFVQHYGVVLTPLVASAAHTSPPMLDPLGLIVSSASFGVGRGFAVLVAIFTSMFALTVFAGHLRASQQRKRRDKRR